MDNFIIFMEIILINLLLSGDNAIIIAMVSNQLPEHQRTKVIWWGTIIAVMLRCLLVIVALPLLKVPFLQALGGLLLLYIAIQLIVDTQKTAPEQSKPIKSTLMAAIWTIITADFIMSLDNVLAIAAIAKGDFVLIMLGISISIPIILWGSQLFQTIIVKYPFFVFVGAGLLAYAAGEMLTKDLGLHKLFLHKIPGYIELIPLICVPLVIALAILQLKANHK